MNAVDIMDAVQQGVEKSKKGGAEMITESIFSGTSRVIPMADVQHIEKQGTPLAGILVVTDKTKWNFAEDQWENAIWISNSDKEAEQFIKAWCDYRCEAENLEPLEAQDER